MNRRVIRFFVVGRVQGVGFRAFLMREAAALSLCGWVRNRSDGSVEALAVGSDAAVASFLDAAGRGPRMARVDRIWEAPADESELTGVRGFVTAATL